jgi:hypothetical protein
MKSLDHQKGPENNPNPTSLLPEISPRNLHLLWARIERGSPPKSKEEFYAAWESLLSQEMRYDGLNYALFRTSPLDEDEDGFLGKLDIQKLGISPKQKDILRRTLEQAKKELPPHDYLDTYIDAVLASLDKDISSLIQALRDSPTLQRFLLENGEFANHWHGPISGKTLPEILTHGTGNCKTFAVMSKIVLEHANTRYHLGIMGIEIIENEENHFLLRIRSRNGESLYDPTRVFYKTAS